MRGAKPTNLAEAQALGAAAGHAAADAFAANVLPVVRDPQAAGVVTIRALLRWAKASARNRPFASRLTTRAPDRTDRHRKRKAYPLAAAPIVPCCRLVSVAPALPHAISRQSARGPKLI